MNTSPFEIFRRNLKPLMVLLTGLALFAFVVLPVLDTYMRQGTGGGGDGIVATFDGTNLSQQRVENFTQNHQSTVRFLFDLAKKTMEREGMPQTAGFQIDPRTGAVGSIGFNSTPGYDGTIQSFMLAREAQKLGFNLDDSALQVWLTEFTDGKFQMGEIDAMLMQQTQNRMGRPHLYEQLRTHLLADVFLTRGQSGLVSTTGFFPKALVTPQEEWLNFLKLNQQAVIAAYGVQVNDYMDQAKGSPTEEEVLAIYEEGKDRFPSEQSPDPGFKRRYSAKFEYVVANRDKFLAEEVAKLKEEDIRAEYEKRKAGGEFVLPADAELPIETPEGETPEGESTDESPATGETAEGEMENEAESGEAESTEAESTEAESTEAESTEAESTEAESTEAESTEAESTEAESTEAESTEAESTEAESTEAESTEAESTEAESTEAESTEAESTEAESTEAESTEAESTEAESTEAESTEAESTEAESTEAESTEAESTEAESTEAESTEAESTEAESTEAESTEAESTEAESTEAESTEAESTEAESTEAESTEAESTEAESTEAESTEAESTEAESTEAESTEGESTEGESTESGSGETEEASTESAGAETGSGSGTDTNNSDQALTTSAAPVRLVSAQETENPQGEEQSSGGQAEESQENTGEGSAGESGSDADPTAEQANTESTEADAGDAATQPEGDETTPDGGTGADAETATDTEAGTDEGPDEATTEPKVESYEDVRQRIAEDLARPAAVKRIDAAMVAVMNQLATYGKRRRIDLDNAGTKPDLKALAEEYGLTYEMIGPFNQVELAKAKEPIADSSEMGMGRFGPNFTSTMYGFQSPQAAQPPQRLWAPVRTTLNFGEKEYVSWKIEEIEAYVPKAEDIRIEIVKAIEQRKARDLAEKAAEGVAEKIRNGDAFADVVPVDRSDMLFEQTKPFSWLLSFGQDRFIMGNVPELDSVGADFMEAVFGCEAGEVIVVPNVAKSTFYVVRPTRFEPNTVELRRRFKQPPLRGSASALGNDAQGVIIDFRKKTEEEAGFVDYLNEPAE